MKIGLISDTHDNMDKVAKAVNYFNEQDVEMVIHAGDFVAPFVFNLFDSLNCEMIGVFGNNDGDKLLLQKRAKGQIYKSPYQYDTSNKKILIMHEPDALKALSASGYFDLIVYGHTHQTEVKKEGKTLVVNPGECGGWLSGKGTIGVVDLDKMEAEIVEV